MTTADGVHITATRYLPASQAAAPPALMLVHGYGAQREVWAHVGRRAQAEGYMAVALDLRGHGDSTRWGTRTLDFRTMSDGAWRAAVADLRAAKEALLDAGADAENLAVVGEGFGAALALRYAAADPAVQALVLVSPSLDAHGLEPAARIGGLGARPVLILAAEQDAHAYTAATVLKQTAAGLAEIRAYAGGAHGADLLAASRNALLQLFGWLDAVAGLKRNLPADAG
ncbi:MAG: alpha/beta hydrolase [Candidatus Hydrogenedentota bacterium]